jgi:cyclophilin family peptidyl-prolyl cis-trans isomerase
LTYSLATWKKRIPGTTLSEPNQPRRNLRRIGYRDATAQRIEKENPMTDRNYDGPPEMTLDPANDYFADILTERGRIRVRLFAQKAPRTVNNFVFLARDGYFDETTFHRVIEGFMAQGGDPTGTGTGGPGYYIPDEFHPKVRHDRPGVLSMANAGPNTGGSQFFITHVATPWLDDRHAVFGEVVEGMEVVNAIRERDPALDRDPGDRIVRVEIEETPRR